MKRLLLGGSINPLNKGDQARVKGLVRQLTAISPDVELGLLSYDCERDKKVYDGEPLEIVAAPWARNGISIPRMSLMALATLAKYTLLRITGLLEPGKKNFAGYDGLVIVSGIDFSDFAGRWPMYYCFFLITLFSIIMKKPVMCYAQSMGPIENRTVRKLAKYFLDRVKTISVREDFSIAFLRGLGVNVPKIELTADGAFLLSQVQGTNGANGMLKDLPRPLIGLSVSSKPFAGPGTGYCSVGLWFSLHKDVAARLSAQYIGKMARIADRLITEYGATLLFLPNCTTTNDNDQEAITRIKELMANRDRAAIIPGDYTLEQSMEAMGNCELIIGTRLHGNILAAIMGVPLMPLVGNDGPRVPGIMKNLGISQYLRNIMTAGEDEILSTVREVWNNKKEIRALISSRVIESRKRAMFGIDLVKEL